VILVDEGAEAVASLDLGDLGCWPAGEWSSGRGLVEAAVRPVGVVVVLIVV
jgi:hypothetical protein